MGLLSASSPSAVDKPKPSTDGAFGAPNRNARAHCWQARDAFFECLERNSIIDSINDAETAQRQCGEQSKVFDRECARSWVCFFFFFSQTSCLLIPSIFLSLPPSFTLGFCGGGRRGGVERGREGVRTKVPGGLRIIGLKLYSIWLTWE